MKRKVEDEELRKVSEVPFREFVRVATPNGRVYSKVYRLEGYDHYERAYWLQSVDDILYLKKGRTVQVGFTY